jgi:hypothetical protein
MNETTHVMTLLLATAHTAGDTVNLKVGRPLPLSEPAKGEMEAQVVLFYKSLLKTAERMAKRHNADNVSAADVTHATGELVNCPRRRFYRHLGAFGGVLVGAALAHLLEITYHGRFSALSTVITCLLFVVGGVMLGVNAVMEK